MLEFTGIFQQQDAGGAPPAGLVVQSVTFSQWTSNVTQHLVAMPATVSSGNLLLAVIGWDGSAVITLPGGWTQVNVALNVSSSGCSLGLYAKSAAGTEGGTTVDFVTASTERMAVAVYRITGWGGTVASDVVAGSAVGSSSQANPKPPSLTSGFGSVSTLWIAASCVSGAGAYTGYPANYDYSPASDFKVGQAGTTADAQLSSVYRLLTASSEDPGTFTLSAASPSNANTFAIR